MHLEASPISPEVTSPVEVCAVRPFLVSTDAHWTFEQSSLTNNNLRAFLEDSCVISRPSHLKFWIMNLAVDSSFDLPLDIFSCIVDVLASEDHVESLKACSLNCRTFHSLCTKLIFATVNVDRHLPQISDQLSALRQFRRFLDRNPTVAIYVEKLDLFIETGEETNPSIPHILV